MGNGVCGQFIMPHLSPSLLCSHIFSLPSLAAVALAVIFPFSKVLTQRHLDPLLLLDTGEASSSLSQKPLLQSPPATKALPHKPNTYVLFYFSSLIALFLFCLAIFFSFSPFIIFTKTNRALHHLSETQQQLCCSCSSERVNIMNFPQAGRGQAAKNTKTVRPKVNYSEQCWSEQWEMGVKMRTP